MRSLLAVKPAAAAAKSTLNALKNARVGKLAIVHCLQQMILPSSCCAGGQV